MTSEIFYARIFYCCLRRLNAKHKIINALFSATKFKAAIIALFVCVFFSFSVNLLTFYSKNTVYPREISSYPKEIVIYPKEITSYPKEMADCPKEIAIYPKEITDYPKEMLTYPKEIAACPKEITTYPKEITTCLKEIIAYPIKLFVYQHDMYLYYIYPVNLSIV